MDFLGAHERTRDSNLKTVAIWNGTIEWTERHRNDNNEERSSIHRELPCRVESYLGEDDEPEVKNEEWPRKLSMSLVPSKLLVGGGISSPTVKFFVRDMQVVIVHVDDSDELDYLHQDLGIGLNLCINFNDGGINCPLNHMVVMNTNGRNIFYAFIPKDQDGFSKALRGAVQKQLRSRDACLSPQARPKPLEVSKELKESDEFGILDVLV